MLNLALILAVLLAVLVGFLAGREYQMTCAKKRVWFDKWTRTNEMRKVIKQGEAK